MTELPEFQPFPKIARLSRDIIVTEKIDGTSAQIYVGEDGQILAASRNRWLTSRAVQAIRGCGEDNFGFASWVEEHADDLCSLGPGRHYGEWWGSGIGRGYGLTKGEKRFSLFNVARWADEMGDPRSASRPKCCLTVPILYRGPFLTPRIEYCLEKLRDEGSVAAPGFMRPEGVVIFHPQGNVGFKKTLEKDAEGKGS